MSSSRTGILTGAAAGVAALERAGVELAFGLPRRAQPRALACARRIADPPRRRAPQQTAAYAADGYARATGRLGVALTTTGPGAANTLGAVGEAWASRQPILVIATDIPTRGAPPGRLARDGCTRRPTRRQQFEPVVKRTYRVTAADKLAATLQAAALEATTPPRRPVYVEIPTDLLSAEAGAGAGPTDRRPSSRWRASLQ